MASTKLLATAYAKYSIDRNFIVYPNTRNAAQSLVTLCQLVIFSSPRIRGNNHDQRSVSVICVWAEV